MKRTLILSLLYLSVLLHAVAQLGVHRYTVAHGLLNNQVSQIIELPNGQLLVATEGAFNLFDGRQFVLQQCRLDSLYKLPAFGTDSHFWQGDSLLWLKDYYWLYLYDVRRRCFRYDYHSRVHAAAVKRFIHEDPDSVKHLRARQFLLQLPHLDSVLGNRHQVPPITAYLRDRQGGQWYGLQNQGLVYLSPHRPSVRTVPLDVAGQPRRMAQCDAHHFLLATTHGIYLIDSRRLQVERTIATGQFGTMDITTDTLGRVYISTNQGLYCYDHGTVAQYHQGNVQGFVHLPIRLALPLADGRLLVCNLLHHLGYLDAQRQHFRLLNTHLPQINGFRTLVQAAAQPGTGRVVVATQNGAFLLDTDADTLCHIDSSALYYAYSQKFNCLFFDRQGRRWMGTHNGLLCDNTRFTRRSGLSNASIRSLAEAPDGSIWVGTSHGINRIKDGNIFSLGAADGLPSQEMTERGALIMSDGTAFFAAGDTLLTFSTALFSNTTETMPVVLTAVQVMNRLVQSPDSLSLTLPHSQNYLRLSFSALHYAAPEQVRYRYRLQGLDSQWLMVYNEDGGAAAAYNAIPPGRYCFQVQCAIRNGAWGPLLNKDITILPPWWQTWWARLAYALFVMAAAAMTIRAYWKRQQQRITRAGEEQVNRMFEVRDEARHHFARQLDISPARLAMNTQEEALVAQLMQVIEKNMSNTDYSVEQMARDVAMERTGLYRKLQAIVGITPSEFLRSVRLKRAAQLLETAPSLSITEISERVGFTSSRHFATSFKQMFGCTPSEYRTGGAQG